jgi:hypothetical protein
MVIRAVKVQKNFPTPHQPTNFKPPAHFHIMDAPKVQMTYPLYESFLAQSTPKQGDIIESDSESPVGEQTTNDNESSQQRHQQKPVSDTVACPPLVCPYPLCTRAKNKPFKTETTLSTHVWKYHVDAGVQEREAMVAFNNAADIADKARTVGVVELVSNGNSATSHNPQNIALPDGREDIRGALKDLQ